MTVKLRVNYSDLYTVSFGEHTHTLCIRKKSFYNMENFFLLRIVLGAVLATYLASHGLQRNSLSVSGAIAAFSVGFISFLASYRFGLVLILFYYTSSKLTKVDEKKKSSFEDDFKKVESCLFDVEVFLYLFHRSVTTVFMLLHFTLN